MNRTAKKARGGLRIAVKVPTSDGGVDEFKMKDDTQFWWNGSNKLLPPSAIVALF